MHNENETIIIHGPGTEANYETLWGIADQVGENPCLGSYEITGWGGADSALDRQIGGDHYKNFVIQPVEFIQKNGLSFLVGCVIKRICRYNKPGGKGKQDLDKIKHEIDLIAEIEKL